VVQRAGAMLARQVPGWYWPPWVELIHVVLIVLVVIVGRRCACRP
jgi:hypothetical protein